MSKSTSCQPSYGRWFATILPVGYLVFIIHPWSECKQHHSLTHSLTVTKRCKSSLRHYKSSSLVSSLMINLHSSAKRPLVTSQRARTPVPGPVTTPPAWCELWHLKPLWQVHRQFFAAGCKQRASWDTNKTMFHSLHFFHHRSCILLLIIDFFFFFQPSRLNPGGLNANSITQSLTQWLTHSLTHSWLFVSSAALELAQAALFSLVAGAVTHMWQSAVAVLLTSWRRRCRRRRRQDDPLQSGPPADSSSHLWKCQPRVPSWGVVTSRLSCNFLPPFPTAAPPTCRRRERRERRKRQRPLPI